MARLLIVAHAPLATALRQVACHVYAERECEIGALDIEPELTLEEAQARVRAAVVAGGPGDLLVVCDAFGATPCKAAQAVAAERAGVRVVAGVNVPMLWRSLCYASEPLDELVERAVGGAHSGVLQVSAARRQNQAQRNTPDAEERDHDQQ